MRETLLKTDLHEKIDHANAEELKELYGLIANYFNGKQDIEEWNMLSPIQQKLIEKGLEQANTGLGTPLREVNKALREKYGLNG
jgi:hypothetical protein